MNEIQTVKIQGQGYLLNCSMSVPKADGNKEYELIKQWLSEGNTPEPEFTEEEIAKQEIDKQISEAKQYLASTDWYITRLSERDIQVPVDVTNKRLEAIQLLDSKGE
jgi:hypothetical protein